MLHVSSCPTQSLFFEKFAKGLLARMGKDVRSNAGLSHKVLLPILEDIENDLNNSTLNHEQRRLAILLGCYLVVCYGSSLQGCKGFMMERSDLIKRLKG